MKVPAKSNVVSYPSVSIVTPSLNHAKYIREAINSILGQNYQNLEYIIMDGGSTDGTLEVLKEYSDRIIWTSEPDEGLYDAVNKGWLRSRGEFIGFVNSDDALGPDAICTMVNYLKNHTEVPLVYGDCYRIDQAGKVLERVFAGSSDLETLLRFGNTIFTGAMLLRRSLLEEIGWLNISLKYAADYDFCIRVAQRYRIGHIKQPLAMFRIHTGSKSQNSRWNMWEETLKVSYKYSRRRYLSLYSRYWIDRFVHLLPHSILWHSVFVPVRKKFRRLWRLGS